MLCRALFAATLVAFLGAFADAQQPDSTAQPAVTPLKEELIKNLEEKLTNVKLIGSFTVSGKEDRAPKPEEYTISSAMKLPEGDVWLIKAPEWQ